MPSSGRPEASTTVTPLARAAAMAAWVRGEIWPWGFSRVPSISNAISLYISHYLKSGWPALWGQWEAECSENRRLDHGLTGWIPSIGRPLARWKGNEERAGCLRPGSFLWYVRGQLHLIFANGKVDGAMLDIDPAVIVGHLHLDPGEDPLGGDDIHLRHQLLQLLLSCLQLLIQQLALLEMLGTDQLYLLQGL